jgi:hypothetical protein
MNFVAVGSESIGHLPLEAQAVAMENELTRINRELPLQPIIDARRQAKTETGNPYDTPYDRLMWDVVGNPYDTFGPKKWRYTDEGYIRYGYHLFNGLSDDDEILSINGAVEPGLMHQTNGYEVRMLHIPKRTVDSLSVVGVELSPPTGTYDVRLHVGSAALEGQIAFRTPSRSDASIEDAEGKVYFNRMRFNNLYAVIKAFDAKYRHLEVLYVPEQVQADILPLVPDHSSPEAEAFVTAA